jgi:hypothetical protein
MHIHAAAGRRVRRDRFRRSVAQLARAPVSKTGGWGFESLHSCQVLGGTKGQKDSQAFIRLPAVGLF